MPFTTSRCSGSGDRGIVEVGDDHVGLKDGVVDQFLNGGVAAGGRDQQHHRNRLAGTAVEIDENIFLPKAQPPVRLRLFRSPSRLSA